MYVSNHWLVTLYVNLNVILRALYFETAVVPQLSGLSNLVKVLNYE